MRNSMDLLLNLIPNLYPARELEPDEKGTVSYFSISGREKLTSVFFPGKITDAYLPEHCRDKANILHIYLRGDDGVVIPCLAKAPDGCKFVGTLLCPPHPFLAERIAYVGMGFEDSVCYEASSMTFTMDEMSAREFVEKYCIPLDPQHLKPKPDDFD